MPLAPEPLRLGVAGFGRLVRDFYLPAFRSLREARVVGIADPLSPSRAAAEKLVKGAAIYSDHRDMLERGDLDGLLVASPPSTHLEIWQDAAAHGTAVFMEKPFVLTWQLPEVDRAAQNARLMLDFNRRFWPPYRRIAELVRGGEIGNPVEVEFVLRTDVFSWSTVTRHRLLPKEGGILHDLGGHAIDLAADLVGAEPVSVAAVSTSREWEGDGLRLNLAFEDGSTFRGFVGYDSDTCERLMVRGPLGRLTLRDPNMAIHLQRNGKRPPGLTARCRDLAAFADRVIRRDRSMTRYTVRGALASFVRSLRTGEPFSPGFDEAVSNVRWLEAAERSLADGQAVRRPA